MTTIDIDPLESLSLSLGRRTPRPEPPPVPVVPVEELERFDWHPDLHRKLRKDRVFGILRGAPERMYLVQEDHFIKDPGQEQPTLTLEQMQGIAIRGEVCPLCRDSRSASMNFTGPVTGIRVTLPVPCPCIPIKLFCAKWGDTANIPLDYRDISWEGLQTDAFANRFRKVPEYFLKLVFAAINQHPKHNILMVGPAGCGKSTLLCGLYHQALSTWAMAAYANGQVQEAVWKLSATRMATEFQAWAIRSSAKDDEIVKAPTLTSAKMHGALRAGFTPFIAIDEFDKFKKSDFQTGCFHELLNEFQSNQCQIVTCSNLGVNALTRALGEQAGAPIMRRLMGSPRGLCIDFYNHTVHLNDSAVRLDIEGRLCPVEHTSHPSLYPDAHAPQVPVTPASDPEHTAGPNSRPSPVANPQGDGIAKPDANGRANRPVPKGCVRL